MNYLENLLATVFSGDVGLSDQGIKDALESIRMNPDRRELHGIQEDIQKMLSDEGADWISLLDNNKTEVICLESQEEAKNYIMINVWKPLFT
jgi:hypothetical protein